MNIILRNINEDNWRECIKLKVKDEQKRFVASNENGLALAYAHKEMEPRGIYEDGTMIGFIMFAKDPDDGQYYINRFMIDEKYQSKGYGREALRILLKELKNEGVQSLDIIHKPDNARAIKIYNSLGFKLTADTLKDDVISRVDLNSFN